MKSTGFTLLEMMITVSLIAILATLISFFYADPLLRSRRVEGQIALMQLALSMETYYAQNLSYSDATFQTLKHTPLSEHAYYQLTIEATENTYTLMAIPRGAQEKDPCSTLTLTHLNQKKPRECW